LLPCARPIAEHAEVTGIEDSRRAVRPMHVRMLRLRRRCAIRDMAKQQTRHEIE
jgi:hypothetical protein